MIVTTTTTALLALLVDRLGDVIPVDDAAFEPPPDTLDAETRRSIKGAYKPDDAFLLLETLDLDDTLDVTT